MAETFLLPFTENHTAPGCFQFLIPPIWGNFKTLIQGLMVMNTEKVWQLSGHLWVPPSREGKGTSTTSELKTSKLNHNCMHHAGDAGNPGNSSSRFGIPSSSERGSKQTTSQWHVPMLVMLYMQGHPLLNTQWLGTQKRRKFIWPFLDPAIR